MWKRIWIGVSSLCGQSYDKIEIVLVDDGSTDSSGAKCDAWAAKDSRIRVIHKENGGLSDARNVGIAASSGEYIAFIDGDDYVAPTYCEKLYEAVLRNDADMAICNLSYVWPSGMAVPYYHRYHSKEERVLSSEEGLLELLDHRDLTYGVMCNTLFKKSLFVEEPVISFPLGRYYEDEFVNYRLLDKAKKIVWIPDVLYSYVQRDDSITHRYSEKHVMDHWALIDESLRWNPREAYKKELMAKKCLALLFDLYRRIQIHQLHSLCTQDMRERMRLVLRRIPQRELSIKDTVKVLLILHGGYGPIFKMKQRIAAFWWWLSASLWRR